MIKTQVFKSRSDHFIVREASVGKPLYILELSPIERQI